MDDIAKLLNDAEAFQRVPWPDSDDQRLMQAAIAAGVLIERLLVALRNVALPEELGRRAFLAALTGITGNAEFFGPIHQGSPQAAVEFAEACARAAVAVTEES